MNTFDLFGSQPFKVATSKMDLCICGPLFFSSLDPKTSYNQPNNDYNNSRAKKIEK